MVTTAVSGVRTTAREARTKRIISVVDSVIAEHYEQLRYRPLPVEIPALYNYTPNGAVFGYEVLADESARVRLMMLRYLQRMELPDRYTDLVPPSKIYAAASPVIQRDDEILERSSDKSKRRLFQVAWYGYSYGLNIDPNNMPPKLSAYRGRLSGRETSEHQGAECLYLILSTSFVGGQPAIGAIPSSNIGDLDGDGMPEILDGWGQPLQFVRWPVGFTPAVSGLVPNVDFELSVDVTKPDDFDLYRADYAYVTDEGPAWATDVNNPAIKLRPWAMKPLIFSLGEDGASGVAVNPGDQLNAPNALFDYTSEPPPTDKLDMRWLVIDCGTERLGRNFNDGKFTYVDPYLRRFIAQRPDDALPGELLGSTELEKKQSLAQATDNITNYQLQVTP